MFLPHIVKTLFLKNVTLCPIRQPDYYIYLADTLHWLESPKTTQYSEHRHRRYTAAHCEQYWNSFNWVDGGIWAICAPTGHVGNISAHIDYPNRTADIGILIGDKHWSKGHGSEAWAGLSEYLLRAHVQKIEAGCMANNKGMIKVFKRCGMKYEGRRIKHFQFSKTKRVDVVYYGRFK